MAVEEAVNQGVETWAWLGPLVGVVTGGVLGGFTQWLVEGRRSRHQRRETLMAVRRDTYFDALDVVESTREAFDDLRIAVGGRQEPGEDATDAEIEEAAKRDDDGVAAFNGVFGAMRAIHRVDIRVSAVGSMRVRAAIGQVTACVDGYMDELGRQIADDGIFRGAAAAQFAEDYASVSENLSSAIRADLDVDRIVNERA